MGSLTQGGAAGKPAESTAATGGNRKPCRPWTFPTQFGWQGKYEQPGTKGLEQAERTTEISGASDEIALGLNHAGQRLLQQSAVGNLILPLDPDVVLEYRPTPSSQIKEGVPMRSATVILVILLCSTALMSQSTEANLQSELEGLHAKWFRAYDSGDAATMDQMEMDKLVLVMPTGLVWTKMGARSNKKAQSHPQTERALTDVFVRRFGDTAILTGILATKSPEENSKDATTVVFVRSSGKWKVASAQWTPVTSQ
ncbi:MAG TPA: nuclear transport factor 2 family protein [Terriglobales bacterium]